MQNKAKLSICVPTFNRADTLELLLESVYRQIGNHKEEVEVCISDNASTDRTAQVVEAYRQKLRIRYHRHEHPIHVAINWNYAIGILPTGEYVLMVGDDDIIINDGIHKMLEMIDTYQSDYYYLNHIHAQVNVNFEKVHHNQCNMEYSAKDCECYNMQSGYVAKWEMLLNYEGLDQEVNMLFIGNHLMKKELWHLDTEKLEQLYHEFGGKPLSEETLDFYYSVWSPQVSIVAQAMMGKKCYYCAEPVVSQGMGENASGTYQVMLLTFLPRWLQLFKDLNMDSKEYDRYFQFISDREVDRYVNLLLYKKEVLKQYPYCGNFIYQQGNPEFYLEKIAEKLQDRGNDYYYRMVSSSFERQLQKIVAEKTGKIVLWGTGDVANNYLKGSALLRENIDYVVDGNLKLHGSVYNMRNLIIHSPEELKTENVYLIVIASLKYESEIKRTIKEYGMMDCYVIDSCGCHLIADETDIE